MVAAFEVLVANNPARNLIREGKSNQLLNIMATNPGRKGMQTLEVSLAATHPHDVKITLTRTPSRCRCTPRNWSER